MLGEERTGHLRMISRSKLGSSLHHFCLNTVVQNSFSLSEISVCFFVFPMPGVSARVHPSSHQMAVCFLLPAHVTSYLPQGEIPKSHSISTTSPKSRISDRAHQYLSVLDMTLLGYLRISELRQINCISVYPNPDSVSPIFSGEIQTAQQSLVLGNSEIPVVKHCTDF